MSFRVGQRVACIDARALDQYAPRPDRYLAKADDMSGLENGRVYTVRSVCFFYGVSGLRLEEILRPYSKFGIEVPFAAARFRPLDERRLDVFRALLAPRPRERATT